MVSCAVSGIWKERREVRMIASGRRRNGVRLMEARVGGEKDGWDEVIP
jgi:hypothetical protein